MERAAAENRSRTSAAEHGGVSRGERSSHAHAAPCPLSISLLPLAGSLADAKPADGLRSCDKLINAARRLQPSGPLGSAERLRPELPPRLASKTAHSMQMRHRRSGAGPRAERRLRHRRLAQAEQHAAQRHGEQQRRAGVESGVARGRALLDERGEQRACVSQRVS